MSLPFILAISLALTLAAELGFALLWGVEPRDLPTVALANVLTNPAVVLVFTLVSRRCPGALIPVTLVLEAAAVIAEGWLFAGHSRIHFPRAFALCANLFSFTLGLFI